MKTTNKTLIDTLGIDWFHSIVWVELRGKPLSDQDLAKVASLKSIRGLVVSGYEIPTNDEFGVEYVSPDISALSLERIGKLRHLQRLRIDVGEAYNPAERGMTCRLSTGVSRGGRHRDSHRTRRWTS